MEDRQVHARISTVVKNAMTKEKIAIGKKKRQNDMKKQKDYLDYYANKSIR